MLIVNSVFYSSPRPTAWQLCQGALTSSSGQQRRGVWDAPQGQSARRVSLDQQLVEGLTAAKKEPSNRRTDEELEDSSKKKSHLLMKAWAKNKITSDHFHCLKESECFEEQQLDMLDFISLVFSCRLWGSRDAEMLRFVLSDQQHGNCRKHKPDISDSPGPPGFQQILTNSELLQVQEQDEMKSCVATAEVHLN